ncbi:hypothetical protein ACKWTF_002792 [Chironomus riparius]
MNYLIRKTFVLTLAFHIASSAQFIGLSKKNTDCSNGTCVDYCDLGDNSLKILPGEYYEKDCSRIWCSNDFSVFIESCGSFSSNECFLMLPDRKLSYPECCNKICVTLWRLKIND